jgi:hypothetical protein
LAFLAGMVASGAIFYRGKPFDARAAILSDLQSPDENPHGYVAAAAGTAISALLLAPGAAVFYQRLRRDHPKLVLAGTVGISGGLAAAVAIGVLAPFTHGYSPLHIQLAEAAFIGISSGTWFDLFAARAARGLLVFQLGRCWSCSSSATVRWSSTMTG